MSWTRCLLLLAAAAISGCAVQETPVRDDEVNQLIEEESPAALRR